MHEEPGWLGQRMLKMNEITNDQNRDDRLDLLRAQRAYYRRAKRLQTAFLFLALILPVAGVFWGATSPNVRPMLALSSIGLLLLEIGFVTRVQRYWVKAAARIQEQFDTEVFQLPWNQFVVGSKVDPEIIRLVTRKPITAAQRKDLEGWYENCIGSLPLPLGRLICQSTNITYDMRVRKVYAVGCFILAILLISVPIYYGVHKDLTLSALLLNIVPVTPFAAFALREHRKQSDTVESLTTLKSEVDKLWAKALTTANSAELAQSSRNLQDAIYRNRASNPLVYDWVYWLNRKVNEDLARYRAKDLVAEAQRSLALVGTAK
jgi:hypothetical protein